MRGARARQARDHDRWRQLDVVDLGVALQQVGEQQPVLQKLRQLRVEVDDARAMQTRNVMYRSQVHVEAFAIVVVAEIVEPGVGGGPGVQAVGVERALGRHRRHHLAERLGFGGEAGLGEVIEPDWICCGLGHSDLCYCQFRNDG